MTLVRTGIRIHPHGAKLPANEGLAQKSNALLPKENWTGRYQFYGNRNQTEYWKNDGKGRDNAANI
jgi:hypothetical protein